MIYPQLNDAPSNPWALKTSVDGLDASYCIQALQSHSYSPDYIISLDPDGFTVGDGTPHALNILNIADEVYVYQCFR